ncbi:TetR/AcrR family transcriptional regulator [Mycobacteriaceae bacterium NPDC060252]
MGTYKTRLLDAALEMMVDQQSELAVADVCRSAGVSARSFYQSFSSTEELVAAVYARSVRDCFDIVFMEAMTVEPSDIHAQIYAGTLAGIRLLVDEPKFLGLLTTAAVSVSSLADGRRLIAGHVGMLFSKAVAAHHRNGGNESLASLAFGIGGGIVGMLIAWARGYLAIDATELADLVTRTFEQALMSVADGAKKTPQTSQSRPED